MQVISQVLKVKKYPKARNIARGNFCVYQKEVDVVGPNDTVLVDVFGEDGNLLSQNTYSSTQFHSGLQPWKKTDKSGKVIATGYYLAF